jgi:hypothetical protein
VRSLNLFSSLTLLLALCPVGAQPAPTDSGSSLDAVLEAIVTRERDVVTALERYSPLVETYLQTVEPDAVLGTTPVADSYFFGRLELAEFRPSAPDGEQKSRSGKRTLNLFDDFHSATFKPERFARMLLLDRGSFDREHYAFDFIRAEFLGEIRTLVFDVAPRPGKVLNRLHTARFTGRIWVEDQDYTIVRFNGAYAAPMSVNFHFDSWRLNLAPDLWLPAYVYTEEPERASRQRKLMHKGQIRIWGYAIERPQVEDEFARVLIDAGATDDRSERPGQVSPVESQRAWEGEAEENVLRRLERAGLLAPQGEVDGVLETVVGNLEITNALAIEPPVRCRVLLTTPLESFTIGHTIVLSRGLIDVLPNEASLAMVLAHELGHILSGHRLETRYAFGDQVSVDDEQALERFLFQRNPVEEAQADERAVELLENSPYEADLAGAGLFLRALDAEAETLPALIRPHFGNRLAQRTSVPRMPRIVEAAPALDPASVSQVGALPLGGRVQLDPWSARVELMKDNRVALISAREKLSFQITPLMPYLARHDAERRPVAGGRGRDRDETVVVTRKEQ